MRNITDLNSFITTFQHHKDKTQKSMYFGEVLCFSNMSFILVLWRPGKMPFQIWARIGRMSGSSVH